MRPPLPPFNETTARQKVQAAEDAWNSRDPERVALAYTEDTEWRNRSEFVAGRDQVREFLRRKWSHELDYKLRKELWAFTDNRIAVRFEYEWHNDSGQWFRSYGNENWEFTPDGQCILREGSRIGWTKAYSVSDERTVMVEGTLRHVLSAPDTLDIENTFTGKRTSR
jgi:nuclear transport factor 2 (NTF2) superfamily protein